MRKLIIICSNNAQTGKTTALRKVGVLLSRKYPIMHIKGSLDERVTEDVRAVQNRRRMRWPRDIGR